jgi:hypothetical protein
MQYLTRLDGSVASGTLVPPYARLTRPTPRPVAPDGHVMLDLGDGEQIGGMWFQKWTSILAPVVVPEFVTPLQARRALRAIGILSVVQAALAEDSPEAQEAWEYSVSIPRNDAILFRIAKQLGMTDTQIDQIFILADSLK